MQHPPLPSNIRLYRNGLVLFYIWILLEGGCRKWLAPGLATPIFFLKYVIIGYLTFYFIFNRERISRSDYPYLGFYFFFLFYCLMQQVNLDVTNTPLVALIGFIVHLGFTPLVFMLPKVITRREQFNKLYMALALVAIPIFVLGIVQYFSPDDSFINKYVVEDMSIAKVGEHVRITTVFSYLAGHSSFVTFVMPFLFVYLTAHLKGSSRNNQIIFLAAFLLGVLNVLMTGARTSVAFFVADVALISIGFALGWGGLGAMLDSFIVKLVGMTIVVFLLLAFTEQGQESLKSFMGRAEKSSYDVSNRIQDQLSPFKFLEDVPVPTGLIGFGLGTTYEANDRFVTGRNRMPGYWEEESERVVIELGIIGFILCTALRLAVFAFSVRTLFTVRDGMFKQIALVVAVLQLPSLIYFNLAIFNWFENILYWTAAGLVVTVYQIDQHEKRKAADLSVASR